MTRLRIHHPSGLIALLTLASPLPLLAGPTAEELAFFETRIRPVLAEKCYRCHSADAEKLKAGLQVDHVEHLLTGGDTGPALVPGEPEKSFLLETIRYSDPDFQMPPKGKLEDTVIADFEKWIAMGAPWPEETVPQRDATGVKVDGSDAVMEAFDLEKRKAEHWCWQPITRPSLPSIGRKEWPTQELDHFILAGLESADLVPAESTSPETWLRRVSFDLVGLPPSPEEIRDFLSKKNAAAKDSTEAEEEVVDRLLASPRFGERWARHWMDLARFAETCGHEFDYPIPHAWRYRDYLIDAFNRDLPYDQFLVEHLAGDLLESPRRDPETEVNASIVGTGFWFLHEAVHAPTDIRGDEADRIDNQIDVFTKSFLGLTVACARCHDHKFDAISTDDYYAMAGFLQSSRRQEAFLDPHGKVAEATVQAERIRKDAGQPALKNAFGTAKQNATAAEDFARYLQAAGELIEADAELPINREKPIAFEDFENGYGNWSIEGDAFGKTPAKGAFGDNQILEGFLGESLVNTGIHSDAPTGRATSPAFAIEKPFLHFLVAGGNYPGKTGVNLLVEGEIVATATGKNNDRLIPHTWDVRPYVGKSAKIEIVDEETGDRGHITVDHIVFSEQKEPRFDTEVLPINRDLARQIAIQQGSLDESTLLRWAEYLRNADLESRDHLLHAWTAPEKSAGFARKAADAEKRFSEIRDQSVVFADFENGENHGWTSTGHAFTSSPSRSLSWAPGNPDTLITKAGAVRSDHLDARFQGVLRSPTFELTHDRIHLRMKSKGGKVRLVIDGHYMNHYHQLLLRGTLLKSSSTDSPDGFRWFTMKGNLDKYAGHRVWIEISDLEGGSVALDEVLLSNQDLPPEADPIALETLSSLPDQPTREDLSSAFGQTWAAALQNLRSGSPTPAQIRLLNLIWKENLWPHRSADLEGAQTAMGEVAIPSPEFALALLDGPPENERVHIRGSHQKLGEVVPRRNLDALGGNLAPKNSSGRLELARELTGPDNPLVRRVIVNRVWHHLFGRGIVPTVDDFGVMGQPPSHPELLDLLASDFSEKHEWSLKSLLRELVLSRTYRMSSTPHPSLDRAVLATVDPENALLHRAPVRRLQAEAVRDAILSVSGQLNPEIGGRSVPIHLTAFMEGRGRPRNNGPLDGEGRRSLYTEIRRNFLPPFLLTFDMPAPFNAMGRRTVSNVPAQALSLMNDPFVAEQSRKWAEAIGRDASLSDEEKITQLFLRAYGRNPAPGELAQIETFLGSQPESEEAWSDLCHALLNKKEFIYLN